MYKNIYSNSFCGGQELEIKGMLLVWGMVEQVVVYEYNGILLYAKKQLIVRLQKNLERLI